jgi:hypothetical protein
MTAMLPLPVQAADGLSTCIIDARLALAPGGLVLALQLARIVPCWLTRRFWELVDGAYFYRSYPQELAPECSGDSDVAAIVDALVIWHTAWLNGALDGAFHWIGDARRESALPMHCGSDVISRYERLAESFPLTANGETGRAVEPLGACGQEAFALAAALTVHAPVILTMAGARSGQSPALCSQAGQSARLQVHGPTDWSADAAWADCIMPEKTRPLVNQLERLGTRIAAVHTFAPQALLLAPGPLAEENVDADRPEPSRDRSAWKSAHVFWHELS